MKYLIFFQKINNKFTNPFYFNITGKDYLDLDMVNGSKSNVVGCNGSARGGRKFCVLTPLIAGSALESH